MATEVSDGTGPKPAPIRINVSSNDSGVMLPAFHASAMSAPIETTTPIMGRSL